MKAIRILTLCVLILCSCNSKEKNFSQELNGENLIQVELTKLHLSMKVPETHCMVELDDKFVINLNPDGRSIRQFGIARSKPVVDKDKYVETFSFDNGAILKYYVFEEDGGNGGIEYELEGILEFGKDSYILTATDQKEFGKGNPEFCLKYISTIKSLQ